MNHSKLIGLSLLLASSTMQAAPCDGFQLRVENQLVDNLLATTLDVKHAKLTPHVFDTIKSNSVEVFTVSQSELNVPSDGKFHFHTEGFPSHKVKLKFRLTNIDNVCQIENFTSPGKYNISFNNADGKATYTISG